jgi:hypothetical protein
VISVRRTTRSLIAVTPGWLTVICTVSLAISLARLAASLSAAGLCLVQPARVRRAASAWNGGESHRALDETLARPGAGSGLAIRGQYEGAWYGSRHLGITGGCRTSLRHLSRCRHDRGGGPWVSGRTADRIVTQGRHYGSSASWTTAAGTTAAHSTRSACRPSRLLVMANSQRIIVTACCYGGSAWMARQHGAARSRHRFRMCVRRNRRATPALLTAQSATAR